jgi:biofilm PGA synthesis N-glycosyltransferase PgaC
MIWYPLAFWLINMLTIVVGLPRAIFKKHGERAVWAATDRGIY